MIVEEALEVLTGNDLLLGSRFAREDVIEQVSKLSDVPIDWEADDQGRIQVGYFLLSSLREEDETEDWRAGAEARGTNGVVDVLEPENGEESRGGVDGERGREDD